MHARSTPLAISNSWSFPGPKSGTIRPIQIAKGLGQKGHGGLKGRNRDDFVPDRRTVCVTIRAAMVPYINVTAEARLFEAVSNAIDCSL
jgi:hypothetical protein